MKAIVQEKYGSPDGLRLHEIEKPSIAADDGALVRIRAASVNASDWHMMKRFPHVIAKLLGMPSTRVRGTDFAGVIESVGTKVTRFKAGDEVFGAALGSFAEYAATTENRIALKPKNVSFEQAAAVPGAACTALQGLRDAGHLEPGERVLVYGAGGGVGSFAVQIAKALGANVTAVTSSKNVDALRSAGADEVLDYEKKDFTRSDERWDVIFDVGANRSTSSCRRVLAPGGRIVFAGASKNMLKPMFRLIRWKLFPRKPGGVFLARVHRGDLEILAEMLEDGKICPIIDREFALSEVPDAIRHLGTRKALGKVVINVA